TSAATTTRRTLVADLKGNFKTTRPLSSWCLDRRRLGISAAIQWHCAGAAYATVEPTIPLACRADHRRDDTFPVRSPSRHLTSMRATCFFVTVSVRCRGGARRTRMATTTPEPAIDAVPDRVEVRVRRSPQDVIFRGVVRACAMVTLLTMGLVFV